MNAQRITLMRLALAVLVVSALAAFGVARGAATGTNTGKTLGVTPAKRNVDLAPTVLHVLDPSSQYISGCFPVPPFACGGPLIWFPNFNGSFGLTPIGQDPRGFTIFAISELAFSAGAGDNVVDVVGSGFYRRQFGDDAQQEMMLFVTVNGEPKFFHSNLVPVQDGPNAIDIVVTINDMQHYDTLMQIIANPGS